MYTKIAQLKAPRRGNNFPTHLSGSRPSPTQSSAPSPTRSKPRSVPPLLDLNEYLRKRDFAAALTLLRVEQRQHQEGGARPALRLPTSTAATHDVRFWRRNTWWVAYCDFHRGEVDAALAGFEQLLGEDGDSASPESDSETFSDPFVARDKLAWRASRACCLFYLQDVDAAEQQAMRLPRDALCNRLLFLLAHDKAREAHDESSPASALLMDRYSRLAPQSSPRDQLAVAFASFSRRNYSEVVDAYKQLLTAKYSTTGGNVSAVHVYLAICYYHLEYFDVAADLLATYLETNPSSFFAVNVKASCHFRLYGADAALNVLQGFGACFPHHPAASLFDEEGGAAGVASISSPLLGVVTHNRAVFCESMRSASEASGGSAGTGSSAAATESVLTKFVGRFPEARLNLALLHLRHRSLPRALELLEDLEPRTDAERMIKGAVLALVGEQNSTRDHVFLAEKLFHTVGSAPDRVDTIPGRQSMASYFLLRREFADALVYLESIVSYLAPTSVAFNWNYGVCLAVVATSGATDSDTSARYYQQALECLERVRTLSTNLANDVALVSWLARCYVRGSVGNNALNGIHVRAWEIYTEIVSTAPPADARAVLKVVANEYYRSMRFYLAAKAFDALERQEHAVDPEVWEAKRGACVGFFRQVATGEERDAPGSGVKTRAVVPPLLSTRVDEVLTLLARSSNALEASKLTVMLKKWVATLKLR